MLFWKRELIWREAGQVGRVLFDPVRGLHSAQPPVADNMALPLVLRARADAEARDFLRWSVLPVARVQHSPCRALVSFGDARFGEPRVSARFLRTVELPFGGAGCR